MLSGCKHTEAAAASEGRRCVVCPALGRESERVVGEGEAKEERRLVLGVQAGTGAQQVHSSPRHHQQTFPLTEKGIGGVGRLLSCHTPLPQPSPHPHFPPMEVPTTGALVSAGSLQQGGLCKAYLCTRIFPQPGQDFLTLQGPSL